MLNEITRYDICVKCYELHEQEEDGEYSLSILELLEAKKNIQEIVDGTIKIGKLLSEGQEIESWLEGNAK